MLNFAKALAKRYSGDEISTRAAALSYFAIFSIGPLLFIILGVIGEILKNEDYRQKLIAQLQNVVGPEAGRLLSDILQSQTLTSKTGLAFAVGAIGLVLGAIGIFGQLHRSFDDILRVKPGPDAGFVPIVRQRLVSLSLIGVVSFLLLVSLLASTAVSELVDRFGPGQLNQGLFNFIDFIISLLVFTVLIAMVYRTLPAVRVPWRVVLLTSAAVALLFSLGKLVLAIIIGRNQAVTAFGASGSLIALLLWVFYSGQLVYLGTSAMSLYVERRGLKLEPRYRGRRGVLRVHEVEEPFETVKKEVKRKFAAGFKKGLQKNKNSDN